MLTVPSLSSKMLCHPPRFIPLITILYPPHTSHILLAPLLFKRQRPACAVVEEEEKEKKRPQSLFKMIQFVCGSYPTQIWVKGMIWSCVDSISVFVRIFIFSRLQHILFPSNLRLVLLRCPILCVLVIY